MRRIKVKIYKNDCLKELKNIEENSIDLIMTSPPYAEKRKKDYGGINSNKYLEWFLPISLELKRVLKETGSFVLNIKEHVEEGSRSLYVYKLIIDMVEKQGWKLVDDYIWHKKNSFPGKWPNRFRDSWEHCFHFTKSQKASGFYMNQDAVKVPIGNWKDSRLKNLSNNDKTRVEMKTGSGFSRNISNWIDKDTVYPSNVLYLSAVSSNVGHSAAYPEKLPEFFIKLFTPKNGVVLDPFMGSGTTGIVAKNLNFSFIGIEKENKYYELSKKRINEK